MPETDHTDYVRTALVESGYDPDSFGQLDTGEQARIIREARQRSESVQ